jgi:molecular chaperone GrpE (heat shock protein)
MLNFEDELDKLLARETERLPCSEAAGLAAAGREFLAELHKKQTDLSLQVEEIYDLVKEQDTQGLRDTVDAERARANQLVFAAMGLSDLLEDFCIYAARSGSEELKHQAGLLWEHSGGILKGQGILRFGAAGELLNPQIHTVKASVDSDFPREQVVEVLQSGYAYQNRLLKKAAVVVSRGQAVEAEMEMDAADEKTGDYGTGDYGTWDYDTRDDKDRDDDDEDRDNDRDGGQDE